jgi:serine/threonine-protein kinase
VTAPSADTPTDTQPDAPDNPAYSAAEQARKENLRERRESLSVDNSYLVKVTDQLFYSQFPERQGQALTDRPADADLRSEWDSIANEVLDVLAAHLSAPARQQLGEFSTADRDQWRQQVNQQYVSSRSLYDLTDAKFAYLYPENAQQDFINQPIGQVWHGLAYDRVQAILDGDRLEEIQFPSGEFSQSLRDRLEPGEGRIYVLNLNEGQLLRVNLQTQPDTAQLSLYVPSPNEEIPYLLEDANERTWSGQLPQTGYYEISVVNTRAAPLNYGLDISADNVTSTPTEPAAAPEQKD